MEDRANKDINGIVDNLNEMNRLVDRIGLETVVDSMGCFPEVDEEWYPTLLKVVSEVNLACYSLGFSEDEVIYYQIKDKWNNLVIHWNLKHWANGEDRDELTECRLDKLYDMVSDIIDRAEEEVKKLLKESVNEN